MRRMKMMNLLTVIQLSVLLTGCGTMDIQIPEEGITVELGSELPVDAAAYVAAEAYEDISIHTGEVDTGAVGTYSVPVFYKEKEAGNVTVNVVDTTAPEAKISEDIIVENGTNCAVEDYVSDIKDLSEAESWFLLDSLLSQDAPDAELNLTEENLAKQIHLTQDGTYRVNILVRDVYGNYNSYPLCIEVYTPDTEAPVITAEDITVEIGKEPDYLDSVTATDNRDGDLTGQIQADTSQVLLDKAGSYPVVYSVRDEAGNEGIAEIMLTVREKKAQPASSPAAPSQQAAESTSAPAASDAGPETAAPPESNPEPAAPAPAAPAPAPTPEPPAAPKEPAATAGFDTAKADELLALVNAERQALGVGTVSVKDSLTGHATEMAQSGDIDGSGVIGCRGTGATSASVVMAHWKENWPEGTWTTAAWKYAGAACYNNNGDYTWVMVFGAY